MSEPIWIWQQIVSPHMAALAAALAGMGREVVYVAEKEMSANRQAQGWRAPELGSATLRLAPDAGAVVELVRRAPAGAVHLCQGLRNNGVAGVAERALATRRLRQWVVMETVEDAGYRGVLKRLEYRRLVAASRTRLEGALAIGHATPQWLVKRGMPEAHVFPFAYFLAQVPASREQEALRGGPVRIIFVGQLIPRKQLGQLIDALAAITDLAFELLVVGAGALEGELRGQADRQLPGRVKWLGARPMAEIPSLMASADFLVLPSRHDGWGAVVSEALIAGTPVVCSISCGAAEVVRRSGQGGVFHKVSELPGLLRQQIQRGKPSAQQRAALANWAACLTAEAGARYLDAILSYMKVGGERPTPPWVSARPGSSATE